MENNPVMFQTTNQCIVLTKKYRPLTLTGTCWQPWAEKTLGREKWNQNLARHFIRHSMTFFWAKSAADFPLCSWWIPYAGVLWLKSSIHVIHVAYIYLSVYYLNSPYLWFTVNTPFVIRVFAELTPDVSCLTPQILLLISPIDINIVLNPNTVTPIN